MKTPQQLAAMDSPGYLNREWIETDAIVFSGRYVIDSPGYLNREWIETKYDV